MGSNIEELRNSTRKWKGLIGTDIAASTYYGLSRGTLMFMLLPIKEMKISKLILVEPTGKNERGEEVGKERIYNVALTEDAEGLFSSVGSSEGLDEICLKASRTEKAIIPDNIYCWNEDKLDWIPWQESELKEFCVTIP
jgi:hypothetical protein